MAKTAISLRFIKARLKEGDSAPAQEYLSRASALVELTAFREQKVLLATRNEKIRNDLAVALLGAAGRLAPGECAAEYARYVEFLHIATDKYQLLTRQAESLRTHLPTTGLPTAMVMAASALSASHSHFLSATDWTRSHGTIEAQAAAHQEAVHDLNGRMIDVAAAAFRCVNYVARPLHTSWRAKRPHLPTQQQLAVFNDLMVVAGLCNSIDYFIDEASFGLWKVDEIKRGEQDRVAFAYREPELGRARTTGVRRGLIQRTFARSRTSWLSNVVQSAVEASVHHAVNGVFRNRRAGRLNANELRAAVNQALRLDLLDAEDEFLVVAETTARDAILSRYAVAIALRTFSAVGAYLAGDRELYQYVSFDRAAVERALGELSISDEAWRPCLEVQLTRLPAQNHHEFFLRPFVALDAATIGVITPLLDWAPTLWLLDNRSGASTRLYGDLWLGFVENIFREHGWRCLTRNAKVKVGKAVVTDVDLVVAKEHLALAIQVKATSTGERTSHDQWKARMAVTEGAAQANLAAKSFSNGSSLDVVVRSAGVSRVRPLVVTNANLLSGWKCNGVSVVGLAELTSWLKGATVKYMNSGGKQLGTARIIQGETPSSTELEQLLDRPLAWRVAEAAETRHIIEEICGVQVRIPQ